MVRLLLALMTAAACLVFAMRQARFHAEPSDPERVEGTSNPVASSSGLIIPVSGVRPDQLDDTFTQARESGIRTHDAIDILAPVGTPVLAAASGRIEKLFLSERGGKTIYQRSNDGHWIYYYAHLDAYRPGLAEGMAVKAGEQIATVGTTGNANPAAPHLHFAINAMAPGERWYQGTPINPYPLLAQTDDAK